jgi:Domain of unknown function (DUF4845)
MTTNRQRGVTLLGLLFWAVVAGSGAILLAKITPAINEYRTVKDIVNKMAQQGGSSVPEVRASFERFKTTQYGIESVSAKDLEITKEDDKIVVSFAYNKEIELVAPVYLLFKFEGRSR